MALILQGKSRCSICGEILQQNDRLYATTHFFGRDHHLWRYSDSGMHWACFIGWQHRAEFAAAYVRARAHCQPGCGQALAFSGKHCSVVACVIAEESITPFEHSEPTRATLGENPGLVVWLHGVGLPFVTSLTEWDQWLSGEREFDDEFLQSCWNETISELRSLSKAQLMKDVDGPAVVDAFNAKMQRRFETSEAERLQAEAKLREHNQTFHAILQSRPPCPHCGGDFELLKYYDNRANDRKSCVICQTCARSSRVEEFRGEIAF